MDEIALQLSFVGELITLAALIAGHIMLPRAPHPDLRGLVEALSIYEMDSTTAN